MNVPKLKKQMMEYAAKHKLSQPYVVYQSPVWGKGAKTLAWRVSDHLFKDGKMQHPTTSKQLMWEHFNPKSLGDKIVEVALGEVGVTEQPYASNDGPRVKQYQAITGAFKQAWCASFVSWVYRHAGYNGRLPDIPAWVPSWHSAANSGRFEKVNPRNLKPGDFVCLWGDGHIEIFVSWKVKWSLANCVGGNTSPAGKNANGGMVARTVRGVREMSACGRAK